MLLNFVLVSYFLTDSHNFGADGSARASASFVAVGSERLARVSRAADRDSRKRPERECDLLRWWAPVTARRR